MTLVHAAGSVARREFRVADIGGPGVQFVDVQGTTNPSNFVETSVASGLSRSVPHTIKLSMEFFDGPSNDVVRVFVDGTLVHTGTTWENYYRFDSEASAEQSPPQRIWAMAS